MADDKRPTSSPLALNGLTQSPTSSPTPRRCHCGDAYDHEWAPTSAYVPSSKEEYSEVGEESLGLEIAEPDIDWNQSTLHGVDICDSQDSDSDASKSLFSDKLDTCNSQSIFSDEENQAVQCSSCVFLQQQVHYLEVENQELKAKIAELDKRVKFPSKSNHLVKTKERDVSCGCSYKDVSMELAKEISEVKEENNQLNKKYEVLCEDNKKLKRSKISKATVNSLKSEYKKSKILIKSVNSQLNHKRKILRRIRLQNSRLINKNEKLAQQIKLLESENENLKSTIQSKNELIKDADDKLNDSTHQIRDLQEHADWLADIAQEDNNISFYDPVANKYSSELREVIYQLLSLNVSAQHISSVINSVLTLVGKTVTKLPSKATILNCNIERLVLAQQQLNEQIPDKPNLTLYTDETTKYGTKLSGYHVSDEQGNMYVLGMRELITKSGQDTLTAFQEILDDMDQQSLQANIVSKKILLNITSTMSDRASTEKRFNILLQELRQTVLPDLYENWDQVSHEHQVSASTILNFFCGLHSLVHFAEAANKSLIEVETGLFEGKGPIHDVSFRKASESGTLRLVRTASKALAKGADEKLGKFRDFNSYVADYLKETQLNSLLLEPFRGNRFNILFESSVAVFFLYRNIHGFLCSNQSNNLLRSVFHDIKVPEYLAGVKALGLISRLITGPLWCLIEDRLIHVLEMNKFYLQLVNFMNMAVNDIEMFMSGELLVFGDNTRLQKDSMFQALTSNWEHDGLVQTCLQVMLPALSQLARKLFEDHLPGGKWEHVTEDLKSKTMSVQKHNKFSESVFGYLDQLLREKTNISVVSSEAYIMFTANKTGEWLSAKDEEQRKILIDRACRSVDRVRRNFKERKNDIEQRQRQILEENREKAERDEAKRIEKLEKFTSKIVFFGLWQTEESVDKELASINGKSEKLESIKAQLNFRRYVLGQKPNNTDEYQDIYTFSKSIDGQRKPLSVDELAIKVKLLVRHSYSIDPKPHDDDIPILNGKNVQHKFTVDSEDTWYSGTVISQVPGYSNWYNIVYKNDSAVYTYQLLDDYRQGNLKIVVCQ